MKEVFFQGFYPEISQKNCAFIVPNFKRKCEEEGFTQIQYLIASIPLSSSYSILSITMRSSGSDSALFFFFLFVVIFHSFHLSRCYALNCRLSKCSDGGPDIQFPFRLRGQPERCGYPGFELLCEGTNTILQLPSGQNLSITDISYHASRMEIVNPYDCFEELLLRLDLTASSFGPVENQDIYDYSYGYGSYDNYTFVACSKDFSINGYAEIPCLSDNTSNDVFLVPSNLNSAALGGGSCHPNKTVLVAVSSYYYDSASQPIYLHWQVDGCEECFGMCRYKNDTTNQTECFYPPPPPYPDYHAYNGCEECGGKRIPVYLYLKITLK